MMTPTCADIYCSVGKIHRVLEHTIKSAIARFDLTVAQFQLLETVASGRATSPAKCGREINLTSSGMTHVLDNLELRGLVSRGRGYADRRFITIHLLPDGLSLYQRAAQAVSASWDEAIKAGSAEQSLLFSMVSHQGPVVAV
ncbi:DNA-binding MarR family transcriptional regulator [Pseudomonas graminis]|uniref:MarR family winged helix-turn-helix transcriptional regulator n=1 Tax=Pseudomonas graminis TaxID=158627 RepID=UPI0010ED4942|nr:MarR family winged helix-turn-helix transcriptional regulator [Pseudomonas graminis]TDV50272.1 DNA-binding MarR family transcriptional regulator [Pseudomonas graminis]